MLTREGLGNDTGGGKHYIKRTFMICDPHQILFGVQIKKNEIGEASSTYGGQKRCIQGFDGEI